MDLLYVAITEPIHVLSQTQPKANIEINATYKDINEISKRNFMEELQIKWIKRERL